MNKINRIPHIPPIGLLASDFLLYSNVGGVEFKSKSEILTILIIINNPNLSSNYLSIIFNNEINDNNFIVVEA